MSYTPVKQNKSLKTIVISTLVIMLVLILAWHLALPLLGISLAITGAIWAVAITTIVLLCIATLLFFLFTGLGIFMLGFFVFAWTLIAMILFPLLFPILLPVLLLMIVMAAISRDRL